MRFHSTEAARALTGRALAPGLAKFLPNALPRQVAFHLVREGKPLSGDVGNWIGGQKDVKD